MIDNSTIIIDFAALGSITLAYLFGSISTAIIACKLMGHSDPREEGSGNPGATNVLRTAGKKAAVITLIGDVLKGWIPVICAIALQQPPLVLALVGLFAFLGHLYPVFFSFKGGKGVATALGVYLGISWAAALCMVATWLIVYFMSKLSSLSAIVAACLAPLYIWLIDAKLEWVLISIVLSSLLVFRHRTNIVRMIRGIED